MGPSKGCFQEAFWHLAFFILFCVALVLFCAIIMLAAGVSSGWLPTHTFIPLVPIHVLKNTPTNFVLDSDLIFLSPVFSRDWESNWDTPERTPLPPCRESSASSTPCSSLHSSFASFWKDSRNPPLVAKHKARFIEPCLTTHTHRNSNNDGIVAFATFFFSITPPARAVVSCCA